MSEVRGVNGTRPGGYPAFTGFYAEEETADHASPFFSPRPFPCRVLCLSLGIGSGQLRGGWRWRRPSCMKGSRHWGAGDGGFSFRNYNPSLKKQVPGMASGTSRHFPLTPTVPGHLFPRAMQGRSCGTGAGPILRPASPLAGPPQAPRQAPRFVSFWNPGKVTSALHPFSLLKQEEALIILAGRAGKGKASQANERRTAGEVREQGRWPKRFIRYSPIPRRRPSEIYSPKCRLYLVISSVLSSVLALGCPSGARPPIERSRCVIENSA